MDKNVDLLEARQRRHQAHIGGPVAVRIERPIADGDHQPAQRTWRRHRDQRGADRVLIRRATLGQACLVGAKREGEKPRLLEQLCGTLIGLRGRREFPGQQTVKIINRSTNAADVIVEREHFRDKGGPHVERRRRSSVFGLAGPCRQHCVTLERRQHPRR